MFPNESNDLPASVDRLDEEPRRIDPRRPPYVPNIRVSREIERAVPFICAVFMDEVQAPVARGARQGMEARTFFFNMMAYNNWENKDCDSALTYVIEYIEAFCFSQNCLEDLERVVQGEMPVLVSYLVANTIERYPALNEFYDQRDQDSFADARRHFHRTQDLIADHQSRMGGGRSGGRGDFRDMGRSGGGYRRDDRDDRYDRRDDRRGGYGRYEGSGRDYDRGSERAAQAYGDRMRRINGGSQGRQGREPAAWTRGGTRQSAMDLYSKPEEQRRQATAAPTNSHFDRSPVTNENFRANLKNPYADMLARRRQKNEQMQAEHDEKYNRVHAASRVVERDTRTERPVQVESRRPTASAQSQSVRQPVNRPNLRRDPPPSEPLTRDPLPWEETTTGKPQSSKEHVMSDFERQHGLPRQVTNTTVYEQDKSLNRDALYYTIDVNSPFIWAPTDKQRYLPSFHISQIRLQRIERNGDVIYEVFEKDGPLPELTFFEGQQSVDFLRHIAPNSVQRQWAFKSSDEYKTRLKTQIAEGFGADIERRNGMKVDNRVAIDQGNKAIYTDAELAAVIRDVQIDPVWTVETSTADALTTADIKKRRAVQDKGLSMLAYRSNFIKVETRISEDSLSAPEYDDVSIHLDQVKEAESFNQLAVVLDKMREDPGADPVFVQMVNDRIIKAINRQLRYSLSIDPARLSLTGNFDVETINEVDRLIKKFFGDYVLTQFKSHQKALLGLIFVTEENEEALNDLYDMEGVESTKLIHLVSHQTMTLINLRWSDLGREIDPVLGGTIDQSSGLISLITRTLDEKAALVADDQADKIYRHLIRTADGILLEIHPGHLAKGARILSFADIDL